MSVIFTEDEDDFLLKFSGGSVVRLDNIDSDRDISDIINRKVGKYYDIYSYNGGMSFVIEVLTKEQIMFSICSQHSIYNRDSRFPVKPIFSIILPYSECIEAIIKLRDRSLIIDE